MRNLTGPPVPPPHGSSQQNQQQNQQQNNEHTPYDAEDTTNPFTSDPNESLRSSSSKSNPDSLLYPSQANTSASTSFRQQQYSVLAGGVGSSSEFDRYPQRKSRAADSLLHAPSHSANYIDNDYSRTNSMSSFDQGSSGEKNPFITNADFSPFGGFPASQFPLHMDEKEADDYLHNPDPIQDAKEERICYRPDRRGVGIIIALIVLVLGAIVVFILLPILAFTGVSTKTQVASSGESLSDYTYNLASVLRSQSLIDSDTPSSAQTIQSYNGDTWNLVFSDEFEVDGRTFYEGDDPYWQAVDIWYSATQDLEWYDPDAATTANGTLQLRLDAYRNNGMNYRSGMIQSWNKLCFTQGHIEIGVRLPGNGSVLGLWPGLWTMGNLGRPGYLASTEGVWPYSYNSCDAGITPNQSSVDGISYLPGQRLASCVCSHGDHPNPGTGRGAPEIDIIEGTVNSEVGMAPNGVASQSLQVAPFDIWYYPDYDFIIVHNDTISRMNSYTGGPFQQAISATTQLNTDWYQTTSSGGGGFTTISVEWLNDDTDGYITWYVGKKATQTMFAGALGPNGNINARQISKEPMSIIMNVGISNSWTYIDWVDLVFPAIMEIDYVRVYQPSDAVNVNCSPDDYPTYDYIQNHLNAYENANLTSWEAAGYAFPKNSLMGSC